jgi:Xaa-Pro aminopeptidase
MNGRVERLRALLEEPLLVTNPVNVVYLVGFQSTNPALLVEPERVQLFTDFRYAEVAAEVPGVEFVETARALLKDLSTRLSGRIAIEADFMSVAGAETLRSGGLDVAPRSGLVERLRAVKDERELDALRRACAITDRVYERLAGERFTGRQERAVAWTMEQLFHDEGGDGLAFDIIVASGPNGSKPHARATDREIGRGETVVIDAGCAIDGYFSDYTRTFATGPLADELREAYAVCLTAQQAGLDAVRPGVSGVDADGAARRVVEESRFAGTFGHGLGHGLGLNVHEAPRLSPESSDTLEPGNVVTVEPGIYLSGRGGIRIEDNVVVTDDGIENLTGVHKDLVEVA